LTQLGAGGAPLVDKASNPARLYQIGLRPFSDESEGLSFAGADASSGVMGARFALAALALLAAASEAGGTAPLYDPVTLNIGINCQWQQACQRRHVKALRSAQKFIAAKHPPLWKIHLCNRNARRTASNIDWVGFNACIRNAHLTRPPARRRR
jgi:hypothetical protein